ALLVNHELAGRGLKLRLDVIERFRLGADPAVGRAHAGGVGMARRVDDGQAGLAGGGEKPPGRLQRLPGVLAAGARIAPIDLAHRAVAALISLVVEIDRQHRGIATDANLATIGLVDFENLLVDDVLPAMVFEISCHACLLLLANVAAESPSTAICSGSVRDS